MVAGALKTNRSEETHPKKIPRSDEYWAALKPDPCKCQNWAELWKAGFKCGMGLENMQMTGEIKEISQYRNKVSNQWAESWCDYTMARLNMPVCINAQLGEREGQWCYVDTKCGKLNGGWHVPGPESKYKLNVKFCKQGDKGKDGKA